MADRSSRGIAVVSVLLLMLAVLTLGLGALVLSRLNLRISENVRSNSVVRYDTEAGIDASMVALEDYFLTNVAFPPEGAGNTPPALLTSLSVTTTGNNPSFEVIWYDLIASDRAAFRTRSTLANGAEHIAETLVGIGSTVTEVGSGGPRGLVSEGTVTVSGGGQGGGSTYIDAGVHGNNGFVFTGNIENDFFICGDGDGDGQPDRDADGTCLNPVSVDLTDAPVSGSPNAQFCSPEELCDANGEPNTQIDPVEVDPRYYERRDEQILAISQGVETGVIFTNSDASTFTMDCDQVYAATPLFSVLASDIASLNSSLGREPTLCITSTVALSVPSGSTLSDVNLVTQGNINFDASPGTQMISNANLISVDGGIFDENLVGPANRVNVEIDSSSIYSEAGVEINGSSSVFSGITTIASAGNVSVDGSASAVPVNGVNTVGLILIAELDIEVNGSADWYLGAVAGGTFTQNGTSFIYGGVESVGDLTINGGIDIDSGLGYSNDVLDEEAVPFIYAISRR